MSPFWNARAHVERVLFFSDTEGNAWWCFCRCLLGLGTCETLSIVRVTRILIFTGIWKRVEGWWKGSNLKTVLGICIGDDKCLVPAGQACKVGYWFLKALFFCWLWWWPWKRTCSLSWGLFKWWCTPFLSAFHMHGIMWCWFCNCQFHVKFTFGGFLILKGIPLVPFSHVLGGSIFLWLLLPLQWFFTFILGILPV